MSDNWQFGIASLVTLAVCTAAFYANGGRIIGALVKIIEALQSLFWTVLIIGLLVGLWFVVTSSIAAAIIAGAALIAFAIFISRGN